MSETTDEILASFAPRPGPRRLLWGLFGTVVLAFLVVVGVLYRQVSNVPKHSPPPPRPLKNAPFIATPDVVLEAMLEEAQLDADDVVYDLGCGDGRILIAAARRHGCRAVGVDLDAKLVEQARRDAREAGVEELVKFEVQDVFTVDLREATVVMLYLLPAMNERLVPQLRELRPGARIICHDFGIRGHRPDRTRIVPLAEGNDHMVHVWERPLAETAAPDGARAAP